MLEYFLQARTQIAKHLEQISATYTGRFTDVSQDIGPTAYELLKEFTLRGKMIRGSLVSLGFELCTKAAASEQLTLAIVQAGTAMELFQSGLLIHDDIMDRDRVRRGKPTIHVVYESLLQQGTYANYQHNAESLGICAGDLAFFIAFELLATLPVDAALRGNILTLAAKELALVGVAQMQDVCNGAVGKHSQNPFRNSAADPAEADIIQLFRYKTGRYTFSLPLAIGAMLAQATPATTRNLEQAGEQLGILFQIKDDELGLFADPQVLGKPVGADIRENKKTLYRHFLLQKVPADQAQFVESCFGAEQITMDMVEKIRSLLESTGVRAALAQRMQELAASTIALTSAITAAAPQTVAAAFAELLEYSQTRQS